MHDASYITGSLTEKTLGVAIGWAYDAGSDSEHSANGKGKNDVRVVFSGEELSGASAASSSGSGSRGNESAYYLETLYQQHGLDALSRLNGWFSGVIVDTRNQRVVLFNDRYGLGRVYYHETENSFYFASEAKCLLGILPATREINDQGMAEVLKVGCVLQNRSLFKGISVLPAGACWTFESGRKPQKRSYFEKEQWEAQEPLSPDEFYGELKNNFSAILPNYVNGDRPVGMSLTGGLDGRMIMAWAKRPPGRLPCYTFGSSYRDCTDVLAARKVARAAGQPYQIIPVNGEFHRQFSSLAERSAYLSDGTMDVTGAVELYVNRIAREIAPVRLTGNYGSEILRGSIAFRPRRVNKSLFAEPYLRLAEEAESTYNGEREGSRLSFIAFKQVPWHHTSRLSVERTQLTMRSPFLDNNIVSLMYRAPCDLGRSPRPSLRLVADGNAAMGRIPTDRGLLYRPVPLLTGLRNRFHEFTFKAEYAYDYGMPQRLARVDNRLRGLHLERLFLGRHKFHHFRVWYRDKLAKDLRNILLDAKTLTRPLFQKGALEKIVNEHLQGSANYTSDIHLALTYELTQRQLIERTWDKEE